MTDAIITLTERALDHVRKVVQKQPSAIGFRIAIKKTGCSGYAYVTDIMTKANHEDLQITLADLVIFVDKNSVPYLQGAQIDFIDHGLGQTKLIFNNPNAANSCGCGESFNLADE
jgi:iron-sulfur cluster assembly protein